jgi:hypothetical protein
MKSIGISTFVIDCIFQNGQDFIADSPNFIVREVRIFTKLVAVGLSSNARIL